MFPPPWPLGPRVAVLLLLGFGEETRLREGRSGFSEAAANLIVEAVVGTQRRSLRCLRVLPCELGVERQMRSDRQQCVVEIRMLVEVGNHSCARLSKEEHVDWLDNVLFTRPVAVTANSGEAAGQFVLRQSCEHRIAAG